jgi:hypothetical protein
LSSSLRSSNSFSRSVSSFFSWSTDTDRVWDRFYETSFRQKICGQIFILLKTKFWDKFYLTEYEILGHFFPYHYVKFHLKITDKIITYWWTQFLALMALKQ